MDVEWSKLVELEHPWYQGVRLYIISRRAEHNSKSYQRYLDGLDLAKFISKFDEEEEWCVTKGVVVLYTKETSVVLGSGVKSNSIPPVTHLQRSTTSKQPLLMVHDRSSLPRSSRLLIKNISQKCSRDDRKMTLGGLHGRGVVQTSGVGAPMVPRGQVIHHQQTCRAQQQVVPTISRWS